MLTATHSIISTYFGSITIVLKFPLTNAASTKGLQRYKGFGTTETVGNGAIELGGGSSVEGDVAEVTTARLSPR